MTSTDKGVKATARRAGVTPRAVRKARDEGRITVAPDGSIDPATAPAEMAVLADPLRGGPDGVPRDEPAGSSVTPADRVALIEARRRKLVAEAEMAELELGRRRGELLPAAEVIEGWQASIGRARSLLLGIPVSVADLIVLDVRSNRDDHKAARAVTKRLEDQVETALRELSDTSVDQDDDDALV